MWVKWVSGICRLVIIYSKNESRHLPSDGLKYQKMNSLIHVVMD